MEIFRVLLTCHNKKTLKVKSFKTENPPMNIAVSNDPLNGGSGCCLVQMSEWVWVFKAFESSWGLRVDQGLARKRVICSHCM